jgi:hypothetical protein
MDRGAVLSVKCVASQYEQIRRERGAGSNAPEYSEFRKPSGRANVLGSSKESRVRGAMNFACAISLGTVLAICIGGPASSATVKTVPGKDRRVLIQISGQIESGDGDVFLAALKQAMAAGKLIQAVQLNSTGGKLGEGAKLASMIRLAKLSTFVGTGAVCASACFLAFAAGDPKSAAPGALIGVHKASEKYGRETALSGAATRSMASFAKEFGVPSGILARMVSTPATQIAWLTQQDLRSMGVKHAREPLGSAATSTESAPPVQTAVTLNSSKPLTPAQISSSWNEFIEQTIALSAEQNQGHAALLRSCKPDSKECVMQVAYVSKDGKNGFATIVQDGNGNVTRREVCESNSSEDVRECTNWDTGAKYRDMKNTKGDWVQTSE